MKRSGPITFVLLVSVACSKGVAADGAQGPKGDPGPPGPQGVQGPAGAPGPVGMTWKGPWTAEKTYAVNDAVQADGATYIAVSASTGSSPSSSPSAWHLVAARGLPGSSVIGSSVAPGSSCPSGGVRYSSVDGDHYVCNGDPGLPGLNGVNGAKGDTGAPGTPGAPGAAGPKGDTGAPGPTGPTGPQGPAGPAGTIAGVMCPAGQHLRGIDASGAAVCVTTGDVAAPSALVARLGNAASNKPSSVYYYEWENIPNFAIPFIAAGGPVQIIPSLSLNGGSSSTCRPLIDGLPAGLFDGEDTTNFWQTGLAYTGNRWALWASGRAYPNVPPGRHLVTLQCKEDTTSASTNVNSYGAVGNLTVIPYGDPATSEVKVATASAITGQSIGCCSFSSISGLATQFVYQGGPVRISLSLPLTNGSHAGCRPLIDGAPAGAESIDNSYIWNEGLVYAANNWVMWTRTRVYDPSTFASPLSIGTHTASVECVTDTASVTVGTGASSANITVVTYKPVTDSATTVHAYRGTTRQYVGAVSAGAWSPVTGLSTAFSSNGGPVEIGLSLPFYNSTGGATVSCRPLVDGQAITNGEPDDFNNTWDEGLQGTYNSGWWQMWNHVRMYRGIPAGSHVLTAQCRTDTGSVYVGNGSMVLSEFAIAYDK